jgi:hypothetical protein
MPRPPLLPAIFTVPSSMQAGCSYGSVARSTISCSVFIAQLAIQRLSSRAILGQRFERDEKLQPLDPQTFFLWELVGNESS